MALLQARLAVLALLTLVAVPGCASDSEPVVDAIDPGIEFTTASGLEVRMVPDPGSGLFASNVFVGAGSTREDDRSAGSSHFLEHLLFNGTERRTQEELYADVDRIGAYNNATTKLEYTHYMMVAPKEEFDAALDIQADMLLHSTLPPDKFEKERGIVLEEMARAADDPDRLRRVTMVNALYGAGSDFSRPVLGTRETIANLRRDDVLAYYQRQYVPSNMKLLLMGDFDPDAARATVERLFDADPGDAVPAPEYPLEERSWMHERRIENDAIDLMIEIPAPEIGHEDYASMMLLSDALGGGDSARLARAMNREPAIEVLEIGATLMDFEGTGVLRISARLPLGTDVDAALERIFGEVATLSTTGLRASEWAGARNRALGQSIRQAEQLHYYALLQGDRIWHGPPGYERRLQVELEASYPRIPEVAARWLGAPVVSVVVAGPDQDDSDEVFDPRAVGWTPDPDAEAPEPLPGGGTVDESRPLVEAPQPPRVTTLENGLTVIHTASPSTRMFALHLLVRDRSAREPQGMAGIADLLHRTLPEGAGNYDREELAALLEGIGAEWKVTDAGFIPYDDYYTTDPRFSFVRIDCVDLYWREAIRVLGLMIGEPRLEAEAIDRKRDEMLRRLAEDTEKPATVAEHRLDTLLLGDDHPLAARVFGTPETLESIEPVDLQRFALDYLDPGQLVLSVVGNLDHDEVIEHLERTLRIGGAADHVGAEVPPIPITETDVRAEEAVGGRQVALRMGRVLEIDPTDRWALEVAVAIASRRMQQDLRETRGWAYSLGMGVRVDEDRARIVASMGTQPQNASQAEVAMRDYLEIGEIETDADEIATVVNRRLGRERMRRVTSIGEAFNLGVDHVFRGSLDHQAERSAALRAVTPQDVARVSDRYLGDGPAAVVVVR
jgi:predicted Zn-dependent peptidase